MKRKLQKVLFGFLVLSFGSTLSTLAPAFSVKEVATKIKLPSSDWMWDNNYKGSDKITGMHPKKTGQAVSLRANAYPYPYSPKRYLEGVREKLMEKPEYKGGEFRMVDSKDMNGKSFSFFKLSRPDEIIQELWAVKDSNGEVLFIIYTAAGNDYFNKYYSDLSNFLSQVAGL